MKQIAQEKPAKKTEMSSQQKKIQKREESSKLLEDSVETEGWSTRSPACVTDAEEDKDSSKDRLGRRRRYGWGYGCFPGTAAVERREQQGEEGCEGGMSSSRRVKARRIVTGRNEVNWEQLPRLSLPCCQVGTKKYLSVL